MESYLITINGKTYEVDVEKRQPGQGARNGNGAAPIQPTNAAAPAAGAAAVSGAGAASAAGTASAPAPGTASAPAPAAGAAAVSGAASASAPASGAGSASMGDGIEIKAGAAGKVWKVVAEAGRQVSSGDTIVILEAMKMEIPVVAPQNGVVASILAGEGESVEAGAVLAILA